MATIATGVRNTQQIYDVISTNYKEKYPQLQDETNSFVDFKKKLQATVTTYNSGNVKVFPTTEELNVEKNDNTKTCKVYLKSIRDAGKLLQDCQVAKEYLTPPKAEMIGVIKISNPDLYEKMVKDAEICHKQFQTVTEYEKTICELQATMEKESKEARMALYNFSLIAQNRAPIGYLQTAYNTLTHAAISRKTLLAEAPVEVKPVMEQPVVEDSPVVATAVVVPSTPTTVQAPLIPDAALLKIQSLASTPPQVQSMKKEKTEKEKTEKTDKKAV
jgi:hypothetical protein